MDYSLNLQKGPIKKVNAIINLVAFLFKTKPNQSHLAHYLVRHNSAYNEHLKINILDHHNQVYLG